MSPRASLPRADELFRSTGESQKPAEAASEQEEYTKQPVAKSTNLQVAEQRAPRHDEKVTFYCTGEQLTRLERARLALRAEHKLSSDRGRIVRAALDEILDEFEARGASSSLVRRLHAE